MPEVGGLELQKRIARERATYRFSYHGLWRRTDDRAGNEGDAIEFSTKPFTDDVHLDAIRQAIERSRDALGREREMQALRDKYAFTLPPGARGDGAGSHRQAQ
jgi:FixJ family two-component response regulator